MRGAAPQAKVEAVFPEGRLEGERMVGDGKEAFFSLQESVTILARWGQR